LARGAARGADAAAARGGAWDRGPGDASVRGWLAVSRGKAKNAAAVGRRARYRELGAILPQMDSRPPRGHLPDSGDERPEARRGQHEGGLRPAAERGAAGEDGVLLRPMISRRDILRGAAASAALAACGSRDK